MAEADPKIRAEDAQPIDYHPEPEEAAAAPALTQPKKKRGWKRPLLMISLPLIVAAIAGYAWLTSGRFVSTDNAYVSQDKVAVSSDVAGRIVKVAVDENQQVKKGDLLFQIDPDPYRIAVSQANAQIADAQVQVATLKSSYAGTGADIEAARDRIQSAQEDYDRQRQLMNRGFTTRARLQESQHAVEQAKAQLQNALADAAEAKAKLSSGSAVPGENPAIAEARVARDKAALDLSRTKVYAPVGGTVTQTDRLMVGQQMMTGLPAVTIVADNRSWIEANFKETDLQKMRPGQPATVTFDAYPDVELKGHVESIGAGTGSEFSVIPAQNATGNWVKVTQRVPVRIAIDEKSPRQLIAGISANVTVDVRDHGQR